MNQRASKLLRKFSEKRKLNYRRIKKLYKTFDWKKRSWVLADIEKGLEVKNENTRIHIGNLRKDGR